MVKFITNSESYFAKSVSGVQKSNSKVITPVFKDKKM